MIDHKVICASCGKRCLHPLMCQCCDACGYLPVKKPFVVGVGCRVLVLQDAGLSKRTDPYMGVHYIKEIIEKSEKIPFQIVLENEHRYVSSVDGWSRLCHIGHDHSKCKGEH